MRGGDVPERGACAERSPEGAARAQFPSEVCAQEARTERPRAGAAPPRVASYPVTATARRTSCADSRYAFKTYSCTMRSVVKYEPFSTIA